MDLPILVDVAIGLSLVYLVASLFVTIANEYIAQLIDRRGKGLANDLKTLISDRSIQEKLAKSPALKPFFSQGRKSSYVDPGCLAQMLVGAVTGGGRAVATMKDICEAVDKMSESTLKTELNALARTATDDVDKFVQRVGTWADQSLTMLGETYKKNTQWLSLGIGLAVAIAFNVDTIRITDRLYRDQDAREAMAATAVEFAQKTSAETFEKCSAKSDEERRKDQACASISGVMDGLKQRQGAFGKLPIGWTEEPFAPMSVLGWVLTGLAISLGSSFWFDLLKRLVNIRYGMRRPDAAPAAPKEGK